MGKPVGGATVQLLRVGTTRDGNLQPVLEAMRFNPEWLPLEKQIAGLAPAIRAARLSPTEALRTS